MNFDTSGIKIKAINIVGFTGIVHIVLIYQIIRNIGYFYYHQDTLHFLHNKEVISVSYNL